MRGLTFEKPKKRYSLSECYANFLTILRIYRTTMKKFKKTGDPDPINYSASYYIRKIIERIFFLVYKI